MHHGDRWKTVCVCWEGGGGVSKVDLQKNTEARHREILSMKTIWHCALLCTFMSIFLLLSCEEKKNGVFPLITVLFKLKTHRTENTQIPSYVGWNSIDSHSMYRIDSY